MCWYALAALSARYLYGAAGQPMEKHARLETAKHILFPIMEAQDSFPLGWLIKGASGFNGNPSLLLGTHTPNTPSLTGVFEMMARPSHSLPRLLC